MSVDLDQLNAAIAEHGLVHRVVIAGVKGSSPRDVGASMLVWDGGQSGTIGGGALEYQAAELRSLGVTRHPLGPELGQCCGGHVTLVTERFERAVVATDWFIRRVDGDADRPLAMDRAVRAGRSGDTDATLTLDNGWMAEPVKGAANPLWVWGAGHVGRAVVDVMAGLPQFDITWIDTSADRFPRDTPQGVTVLPTGDLERMMTHAPQNTHHLIFTYSHPLDLALCHGALLRGFACCGVIGSRSKWARFRKRLGDLGHSPAAIDQITCPIGNPSLGKHPKEIAIGVATVLMSQNHADVTARRASI